MPERNFVYLVGAASGPPYKVGHSTNPEGRLASFLAGSHAALAVLRKWERNGDAGKVERLAHKKLRASRVDREWFAVSLDEALAAIEAAIAEIDNPPPARSLLDLASELRGRGELEAAAAVVQLHERKMARQAVAKKAGDAFARNQAARRDRAAKKMAEIERMWRDPAVSTGDVLRAAGLSRHALYKRYGGRGTPRFGRDA